jgi:hypothetical protein
MRQIRRAFPPLGRLIDGVQQIAHEQLDEQFDQNAERTAEAFGINLNR